MIRMISVLLWGLTFSIYGQFATTVELPPGILTSGIQPTSRSQRAINEIQASLIYSMFTKPMFNINAVLEDMYAGLLGNPNSPPMLDIFIMVPPVFLINFFTR